ncbi:MAG: hypothetical protein ACR2RL_15645 [Gammaproteobacteria bacterium]
MIIKDVRTHLLSVPYVDSPEIGLLPLERIDLLIVEVETRSDIVDTGFLHPIAGGMRTL